MTGKVAKTDQEWRAQLTPEQYQITRRQGTERPFSGAYCDSKAPGSMPVSAVDWSCSSPRPNMIQGQAGRASGSP